MLNPMLLELFKYVDGCVSDPPRVAFLEDPIGV